MRKKDWIPDVAWVAVCCVATFLLKLWAHQYRTTSGHGDTCYYFHVAENLFNGRGFVCDYVWSFLENPSGRIPNAPSNAWWMPGPSIVSAIGMWFAGAASYAAAKTAMALLTSLYPAVVWLTARAISKDRSLALRAALLSVAFHPLVDQPAAPLSHGPYGLFVGAALVLLAAGPLTIRRGFALGALAALGHYFRGDALTIFGTAGLLALVRVRRDGFVNILKPLGAAVIGYVLVMSPWFARNLIVFGSPMAPGPGKALYLRDYYDWFALPDRLTASAYMRDGIWPLITEKFHRVGESLYSYWASYYDPTIESRKGGFFDSLQSMLIFAGDRRIHNPAGLPPPWYFLRPLSIIMSFMTFGGLALLIVGSWRKATGMRWIAVFGLHSAAEIVFYAVLFTGVASQSYVSSMYSLYPLFVVGIAAACNPIVAFGANLGKRAWMATEGPAWLLILILAAANAVGVGAYERTYKGPKYLSVKQQFAELGAKLRSNGFNPAKDRVMIVNTWDFFDGTGMPCVRIPDEPLVRILESAKRAGVGWMLVDDPVDANSLMPRRRYRTEIYSVFDKENSDYFWKAFDFPELGLHAVRIRQIALDYPRRVNVRFWSPKPK